MARFKSAGKFDDVSESDNGSPFHGNRAAVVPRHLDAGRRVEVLVPALEQPGGVAPLVLARIGDVADVLGQVLGGCLGAGRVQESLLLGVAVVGRVQLLELVFAFP